jgi:hypothetical protein
MKWIFIFLLIISHPTYAFNEVIERWGQAYQIQDKHEYYKPFEVLKKPQESWQILFSVKVLSENLTPLKDCVYYYVSNTEGVLKVKTIEGREKCADYLFQQGDFELKNLRSLQYSVENGISLIVTYKDFSFDKWEIKLTGRPKKIVPKLLTSSSHFKIGSSYILLSKDVLPADRVKKNQVKQTGICHHINENCQELTISQCSLCEKGWYEVPNGCPRGPKYCGIDFCGLKGKHACIKGKIALRQKKLVKLNCEENLKYFYCSKGALLQCEGSVAVCR